MRGDVNMTKKIFGLVVVCLMVLSLLLPSCGEEADQEATVVTTGGGTTTTTTTTTETEEEEEEEEVTVDPNDPQYGGTIVLGKGSNWQDFDEIWGSPITFNHPMRFTSQELWIGDWAIGPGGTEEIDFSGSRVMLYKTGDLAESWDFSGWDDNELIFYLRPGCHFGLDTNSEASRLVGGREVTAEDVAYSFLTLCTSPTTWFYKMYPYLREAEAEVIDRYTIKFSVADSSPANWCLRVTDFFHVFAPEVHQNYDMADWRNLVGSGPFMLTDLIDSSSITFTRNPDYWMTNTGRYGTGDQLPYVDKVRCLVIADTNTLQSAFRTGHIDNMGANWEDGPGLIDALPDVSWKKNNAFGGAGNTGMRTDKEPFNDIRVRKAVFKALDFRKIATALFGEGARWLAWPIGYSDVYKNAYLDVTDPDCPEEVIDIYTYDVQAAKDLLTKAGHPDGIKGNCIVLNSTSTMDYFQTLQSYWAEAGIDISLDPREQGAWYTILQNRDYDFMMYGTGAPITNLHGGFSFTGKSATNPSYVDDPVCEAAIEEMMKYTIIDDAKADEVHRELMKHLLAQCYVVPMPGGVSYSMWWPWLKNYYGALSVGYMNTDNWVIWAWVDQDLKTSMGR
jgi:peptide/nickel transport system substrate-binding protein